jgi:hypothetical protein
MGHDKLFQKKNVLTRPEKTRKLRRILIVCEGTKTEPNYFSLKNDPGMYSFLNGKQSIAIQNARKLYNKQCFLPFKDRNPITTVFQLVERLIG